MPADWRPQHAVLQVLARGYWPSYNVAFFPRIYSAAGYPDIIVRSQDKGREYDEPARWLMYQVSGTVAPGRHQE